MANLIFSLNNQNDDERRSHVRQVVGRLFAVDEHMYMGVGWIKRGERT